MARWLGRDVARRPIIPTRFSSIPRAVTLALLSAPPLTLFGCCYMFGVRQAVAVWEEARETDALHAIDASLYDMAIGAYRKQGAFDKVGKLVL